MDRSEALQALVDALSLALKRPVLLDDAELVPLAYSSHWGEIDRVRNESIMRRAVSPVVRRALLDQGIADAHGILRTLPEPEIEMEERVCAPVRCGPNLVGYLWLLDAHHELDDEQLERIVATARHAARVLAAPVSRSADESDLVARLLSERADERDVAAAELRERGLLPERPLVVCALGVHAPGADVSAHAHRMAARLSAGHAVVGTLPTAVALLASLDDRALSVLREDELVRWLAGPAQGEVAVGQSAPVSAFESAVDGWRQACVALRAARAAGPPYATAWSALGAERLIGQLPAAAAGDVPARLTEVLRAEPQLAETLATFLDAAGDIKATAERLNLHRSGLYYRLRRVEELSGLDLSCGDDRLLAHIAVRLMRLG